MSGRLSKTQSGKRRMEYPLNSGKTKRFRGYGRGEKALVTKSKSRAYNGMKGDTHKGKVNTGDRTTMPTVATHETDFAEDESEEEEEY